MKRIKVGRKFALVDAEFYPLLILHQWHLQSEGYARTYIGGRCIYMHELVKPKKPSEVIDHLNFNRLDNRAKNLNTLSNNDNLKRTKNKMRKDLGVGFHVASNKWRARIVEDGKEIYLGIFTTKKAAITARENHVKNHSN